MNIKALLLASALAVTPVLLMAEQSARGSSTDSRIRTYTYHADEVYRLIGATGYGATVVLEASEVIENVTIGDEQSWHVDVLDRRDRFLVKPKRVSPQPTTLTIHTNRRIYSFLISAGNGAGTTNVGFRYGFRYPDNRPRRNTPQTIYDVYHAARFVNVSYSASGGDALRPDVTFDDGRKTYIRLRQNIRPSVFVVNPDGSERLVNTSDLPDGTVVVRGVYSKLVLRDGARVLCIFNTTTAGGRG